MNSSSEPRDHAAVISAKARVVCAIKVDLAELGASMEAYAENKGALHALRLCAQHSQTALGGLPTELIDEVASILQADTFETRLPEWKSTIHFYLGEACRCYEQLGQAMCDVEPRYTDKMSKLALCKKIIQSDFKMDFYFPAENGRSTRYGRNTSVHMHHVDRSLQSLPPNDESEDKKLITAEDRKMFLLAMQTLQLKAKEDERLALWVFGKISYANTQDH